MAVQKLDKEIRKSLLDARSMIDSIVKSDANEADTRSRIEHIFKSIMGYDLFKHISHEHIIRGVGDADYCDFAIHLESGDKFKPVMLVEIKRVNIDLAIKHLKQAASYAINIGCEWAILTNGRDWQLYHIYFGQPPQTTLVDAWHLMTDELAILANKFQLVCYKNVKRGSLDILWQKSNVLTPRNVLKVILSEPSISMIRRELKRDARIALSPEEIVGAIRRLLNENAVAEIESIKICLPSKPRVSKQKKIAVSISTENIS